MCLLSFSFKFFGFQIETFSIIFTLFPSVIALQLFHFKMKITEMLNFKHPTHSHALPRHSICRDLLLLDYYSLLDIVSFLQLPVCGQK